MPNESQIFDTFASLTANTMKEVWLPTLYNVSFKRKRSWFVNRIKKSSRNVKGLKFNIPFLLGYGWSWRPMGEHGYTPTGSPLSDEKQEVELGCHAASVQVSHKAIMATQGDVSLMGDLQERHMKGLMETFPYYMRSVFWSPSSGILGIVSGISGTTVTLSNTGLWNVAQQDRCKYLEPDMYIQFMDATGATKRGDPVKIVSVDKDAGTLVISADPGGITSTDIIVISDIAGLENAYNMSSPGILDAIDDDNTFQGTDRSAAANAKLRAVVHDNGGTDRALTYDLASQFFHDCYDPEYAIADYRLVDKYWQDNIRDKVRYSDAGGDRSFDDGFQFVRIGRTKLVEDDDAHIDKVIVPDMDNLKVADKGEVTSLFGQGWRQIPGRPFLEYPVVYWALLYAEDCRQMGRLDDLSITA